MADVVNTRANYQTEALSGDKLIHENTGISGMVNKLTRRVYYHTAIGLAGVLIHFLITRREQY